jgi:transcriptional regulator with XRE-family HTH domain
VSDSELGTFLRTRREAVTPAEVGLPTGGRRRTPGLRRAELATLAGVSIDYLVRLEQGRDRHPSPQVLAALADALRLSAADRELLHLAAKHTGGDPCPAAEPPAETVRPAVLALLDRLDPTPAYVSNRLGDVLALTSGFQRLAEPVGLLDGQPPNVVRFVFADDRARAVYPEWNRVADEQVALLKVDSRRADPHATEFAKELEVTAGAAFTERWAAPARLPARSGVERWVHPEAGELRLAYEILELPDGDDQRLVVYLPADGADRLRSRADPRRPDR